MPRRYPAPSLMALRTVAQAPPRLLQPCPSEFGPNPARIHPCQHRPTPSPGTRRAPALPALRAGDGHQHGGGSRADRAHRIHRSLRLPRPRVRRGAGRHPQRLAGRSLAAGSRRSAGSCARRPDQGRRRRTGGVTRSKPGDREPALSRRRPLVSPHTRMTVRRNDTRIPGL